MKVIKSGDKFESTARETFNKCIDVGFNPKKDGYFGKQKHLYCEDEATKSGDAVWMLRHLYGEHFSNDQKESWKNEISSSWNEIIETYLKDGHPNGEEKRLKPTRIVFAWRKDIKKYMFLGVYKRELISKNQYKYTRISKVYPK